MADSAVEMEGNMKETINLYEMEDETNKNVEEFVTDQPNKLEVQNNNIKCRMDNCIRSATTKCGLCEYIVCDNHIGVHSKKYGVLCQSCNNIKNAKEYDQSQNCINTSKRIFCNKCSFLIIGLCICLLIVAAITNDWI